MTVELSDQCRQRLEEVQEWFASLPEGVAAMEVKHLQDVGVIILTIRPLLNTTVVDYVVLSSILKREEVS